MRDIPIIPKQNFIQFPDLNVQIDVIKPVNTKQQTVRHEMILIFLKKNHTIQHNDLLILKHFLA